MEEWKSENLKPEDAPEVKGFEEKIQEIPEKENTSNPVIEKNEKEITIKKSTYNNLLKGLVIAIGVAAFFSGYFPGLTNPGRSALRWGADLHGPQNRQTRSALRWGADLHRPQNSQTRSALR